MPLFRSGRFGEVGRVLPNMRLQCVNSSSARILRMTWQLGASIVGAVAVVYGLLISFGLRGVAPATRSRVVKIGALIILVLAGVLVLLPLLKVY